MSSSDFIIRPGANPKIDIEQSQIPTCLRYAIPIKISEAILKILRHHFSDANNIELPQITNKIYDHNNRESSPLWIGSLAEWNPAITGNRPAILVERLDQKYIHEMRTFDDSIQIDTPRNYYVKFFEGQHLIHVLGGRELESEYIAYETFMQISNFSPIIRSALDLILFLPYGITRRRQLSKEYKEHYSIQIPITYRYQEIWRIFRISGTNLSGEDVIFNL